MEHWNVTFRNRVNTALVIVVNGILAPTDKEAAREAVWALANRDYYKVECVEHVENHE